VHYNGCARHVIELLSAAGTFRTSSTHGYTMTMYLPTHVFPYCSRFHMSWMLCRVCHSQLHDMVSKMVHALRFALYFAALLVRDWMMTVRRECVCDVSPFLGARGGGGTGSECALQWLCKSCSHQQ
jgi:hypothetical protein